MVVLLVQFRAWLRKSLNQGTLQFSLQCLAQTRKLMARCYQPWALMVDGDSMADVLEALTQLDRVQFDNLIDDPTLDSGDRPTQPKRETSLTFLGGKAAMAFKGAATAMLKRAKEAQLPRTEYLKVAGAGVASANGVFPLNGRRDNVNRYESSAGFEVFRAKQPSSGPASRASAPPKRGAALLSIGNTGGDPDDNASSTAGDGDGGESTAGGEGGSDAGSGEPAMEPRAWFLGNPKAQSIFYFCPHDGDLPPSSGWQVCSHTCACGWVWVSRCNCSCRRLVAVGFTHYRVPGVPYMRGQQAASSYCHTPLPSHPWDPSHPQRTVNRRTQRRQRGCRQRHSCGTARHFTLARFHGRPGASFAARASRNQRCERPATSDCGVAACAATPTSQRRGSRCSHTAGGMGSPHTSSGRCQGVWHRGWWWRRHRRRGRWRGG